MGAFGGAGGLHVRGHLFCVLARVRGELPGWCAGDAGMVPLSSRETAKGGEQETQLAALRQVSPILQRSHPRAKRKPDPRIKARHPGASPLGSSGRKEKDTTRCAQTSVVDFLTQSPVS